MSTAGAPSLSGRVALVTGATSGIGREVALGLARLGATTIVAGRGEGRASRVAAEIAVTAGNSRVEGIRVNDLAVLADMRELAAAVLDRHPALHILVNNAGGYFRRREVTTDGLERTFALNVLSPYVLTTLLGPRLVASAPSRVVNVASAAHEGARADLSDLQSSRKYSGFRVYGASKLELIWLTREYGRRLTGRSVTVNSVHPGFVRSGFGLNNGGGVAFAIRVLGRMFGRSVVRGADTPIYVASSPELASVTGGYFADRKPRSGSHESLDLPKARELVNECARLSGIPPIAG